MKTNNSEQLKTAIKLLKNVRRELIDYNGVDNAIAEALYILIKSVEETDNKTKEGENEQ